MQMPWEIAESASRAKPNYVQRGAMKVIVVPRADFERPYFKLLCRLCEAQNWRCCYCGIRMMLGREGDWTDETWRRTQHELATVEHVVPRIAGGSNDWENLTAACRLCNNARSAMNPERYFRFVLWKGRERAARYANRLRAKLQRRDWLARQSCR